MTNNDDIMKDTSYSEILDILERIEDRDNTVGIPTQESDIVTDYELFESELNRLKLNNHETRDLSLISRDTDRDFLADSLDSMLRKNPEYIIRALERDNSPYYIRTFRFASQHVSEPNSKDELDPEYLKHNVHYKDGEYKYDYPNYMDFSIRRIDPNDVEVYVAGVKQYIDNKRNVFLRDTGNGYLTISIHKDLIRDGDIVEVIGINRYTEFNKFNKFATHYATIDDVKNDTLEFIVEADDVGSVIHSDSKSIILNSDNTLSEIRTKDIGLFYKPDDSPYMKPFKGVKSVKYVSQYNEGTDTYSYHYIIKIPNIKKQLNESKESWSFMIFNHNHDTHFTLELDDTIIFNKEFRKIFPMNDVIPLAYDIQGRNKNKIHDIYKRKNGEPFLLFIDEDELDLYYNGLLLRPKRDYRVLWHISDNTMRPYVMLRGNLKSKMDSYIEMRNSSLYRHSKGVAYNEYIADKIRPDGIIDLKEFNLPLSNKLMTVYLNGFKVPSKNIEVLNKDSIKIHRVKNIDKVNNVYIKVSLRNSLYLENYLKQYYLVETPLDKLVGLLGRERFFSYINERKDVHYDKPDMHNGFMHDIDIAQEHAVFIGDIYGLTQTIYTYEIWDEEMKTYIPYPIFRDRNGNLVYVNDYGTISAIRITSGEDVFNIKEGYTGNELGFKLRIENHPDISLMADEYFHADHYTLTYENQQYPNVELLHYDDDDMIIGVSDLIVHGLDLPITVMDRKTGENKGPLTMSVEGNGEIITMEDILFLSNNGEDDIIPVSDGAIKIYPNDIRQVRPVYMKANNGQIHKRVPMMYYDPESKRYYPVTLGSDYPDNGLYFTNRKGQDIPLYDMELNKKSKYTPSEIKTPLYYNKDGKVEQITIDKDVIFSDRYYQFRVYDENRHDRQQGIVSVTITENGLGSEDTRISHYQPEDQEIFNKVISGDLIDYDHYGKELDSNSAYPYLDKNPTINSNVFITSNDSGDIDVNIIDSDITQDYANHLENELLARLESTCYSVIRANDIRTTKDYPLDLDSNQQLRLDDKEVGDRYLELNPNKDLGLDDNC